MSASRAEAEWRRAQESLTASRLCQRNGLYADAISSAYYAVMHTAKSALELREITADTHKSVNALFGQHIVLAGLVERTWGREIGPLSGLRIVADYDVEVTFTEPDGRSAYERAEAFLNRIRPLLAATISLEEPDAPP
jgi:uncharacterized protein (UPF0332 family)